MIDYRDDPETGIAEIIVDGPISRADFDDVSARLAALIERCGRVRILEDIRRIGRIEPSVIPADVSFSFRHMKDFSHCAIVGERKWLDWLARAIDPPVSCEIRYFDRADIEEARGWLRSEAEAR